MTGRVPGMVFWGDLYDDFLDHSGLRSGNGAGGVVRLLVCGRRWVFAVVGTSRLVRWRGDCAGATEEPTGGVAVALVCGGE
ncbi:hypothetical protein [Rhodococcus qingshengii]|uniref:hypothetical protein n=1 Tax=Rhodococcus qingshengii TaxID=334542 RepID=UPI002942E981|nr:hypothetical protein [Rhodococcus qingshengii]WOI90365.1 hypothetical protein R0122_29900 [Rhodococcus qingshengii]